MKHAPHIKKIRLPLGRQGFTIFFAVLVSSLALAVGVAIYDLLSRELLLSQTATQSQYAIYAADTGAECALYWDSKYGGAGSAFATSTTSNPPASGVTCTMQTNGSPQDIAANGTPPATFGIPPNNWTSWSIVSTADAATTTFYVLIGSTATSPCAQVTVGKSSVGGSPSQTNIVSHGYNTCANTGVVRIERALQVTY
jgi:hypothetical protein